MPWGMPPSWKQQQTRLNAVDIREHYRQFYSFDIIDKYIRTCFKGQAVILVNKIVTWWLFDGIFTFIELAMFYKSGT